MLGAVTPQDLREVVLALVKAAKEGNIAAAKEVLDRCLGRPIEADLLERLEALEAANPKGGSGWGP
jgi:hypothetical protein